MRRNEDGKGHRRVKFALPLVVLTLGTVLAAGAQTEAGQASQTKAPQRTYETITLHHATDGNQEREIVTVLRNMLGYARIDMVSSEDAIAILGTAEELETAHRIVAAMDQPVKSWRLTYTLSDPDGGQGSHRYSLTVASGRSANLKQGKRVPIMIGILSTSTSGPSNQVEYLDIGVAIDAQVDGGGDTLRVKTKIEQSGLTEEKSGIGVQDPVVRQTTLENTVTLTPGKSAVLGSLEGPVGGKRQDVSVVAEAVE